MSVSLFFSFVWTATYKRNLLSRLLFPCAAPTPPLPAKIEPKPETGLEVLPKLKVKCILRTQYSMFDVCSPFNADGYHGPFNGSCTFTKP